MGSKVERVKRSKEKKTSNAQMEIVDWAFETRWTEFVRRRSVLNVIEGFNFFVLGLLISSSSSSGKKMRKKPIPQISAALAVVATVDNDDLKSINKLHKLVFMYICIVSAVLFGW